MNAPTGLVTLLFTDVEGSTVLWEKTPEAMRTALDLHNSVIRKSIGQYHGYEVKTEGDAFMIAFNSSLNACLFCLEVQEKLLREDWPAGILERPEGAQDITGNFKGLRIRMGFHSGYPECRLDPVNGRMDYFGPMVNRSARISGAGHGGQILASEDAVSSIFHLRDSGVRFMDLGDHALKGIEGSMRIFQISSKALKDRIFPPLKTGKVRLTNLCESRNSFIGRHQEMEAIADFLGRYPLVTVTGPGGIGKTRIVKETGQRLSSENPETGVWFCDASNCRTIDDFIRTVAENLHIGLAAMLDSNGHVGQVGHAIASRGRMLIILDNLEQVIHFTPGIVDRWIECCPAASFLVTSRIPLGISGEQVFELGILQEEPALLLFEDRARLIDHSWQTSHEGLEELRKLVRDLDCIPLAIELAAARTGIFSLPQLRVKIRDNIDLLKSREKNIPTRQATLRGAIEWSLTLLDSLTRKCLGLCSIFSGGFTYDALEAVLEKTGIPADPLEVIETLRNCSLIRRLDSSGAEARYGMYETIRSFVRGQFENEADYRQAVACHAEYFIDGAQSRKGIAHVRFVAAEMENIVSIHDMNLDRDWEKAAQAVIIMTSYLKNFCPTESIMKLVNSTIACSSQHSGTHLLAQLYATRSNFHAWFGRTEDSDSDITRAQVLAENSCLPEVMAYVLFSKGMLMMMKGRMEESREIFQQALHLTDRAGQDELTVQILESLALSCFFSGKLREQLEILTKTLSLVSYQQDTLRWACIKRSIGESSLNMGNYHAAVMELESALPVTLEYNDHETCSHVERLLGTAAIIAGQSAEAMRLLESAEKKARELFNFGHLAIIKRLKAITLILGGNPESAIKELTDSIPVVETCAIALLQPPLYTFLGSACVLAGKPGEGEEYFLRAREKLSGLEVHWQREALEVLEALIGKSTPEKVSALAALDVHSRNSVDLVLAQMILKKSLQKTDLPVRK